MTDPLYLGRIVAVARNRAGARFALYRVSSRSFPNRTAAVDADASLARIVPKPGHEGDVFKNPYIAYHCGRMAGDVAVVTNGSHTDPIAEKIAMGTPVRDAMIAGLATLDYEKDDYNTPRVAAAVRPGEDAGWLGTVREDGLDVRRFGLEPGEAYYCATYTHDVPCAHYRLPFDADSAGAACDLLLGGEGFDRFAHPVSAVAFMETAAGFAVAAKDAPADARG